MSGRPSSPRPPGPSRLRAAAFRVLAVLAGLTPFVLFELVCIAFDWGRPDWHEDPFVGFSSLQPLFVRSDDGSRYEIPRARQSFFRPESFAARKAPGEFRIFVLGGSTVQGRPFATETSFTTWLELDLRAADPNRRWEVVNCGGVSYASYRLVPILEEVLGYGADLVIVYTGHNEFLEDRQYGSIRDLPPAAALPAQLAARTRTFCLLSSAWRALSGRGGGAEGRAVLGPEADAILDYRDGLKRYHHDEAWRRGVVAHYRANLRRMVGLCRDAGVPLVLVRPVAALRGCPPFKSEHRPGLGPETLRRWEALCRRAGPLVGADPFRAAALLREAAKLDDRYAAVHYLLGECLERTGRLEQARAAYLRAKDTDVCPLRMIEPLYEALDDVARRTGTPLVDARGLFRRRSPGGICGGLLLADHVHPTIPGHRLIAEALLEHLARLGVVRPRADWRARAEAAAKCHLDGLGELYFAQGRQRLRRLRGWAEGRAQLIPSDSAGDGPN